MTKWWSEIVGKGEVNENTVPAKLIEKAVSFKLAQLSKEGALVFNTGSFSGRAAKDKYIVQDEYSLKTIDWTGSLAAMTQEKYSRLKKHFVAELKNKSQVFVGEKSVGADSRYSLGVKFVTTNPVHALFIHNMLRSERSSYGIGLFTLYHIPEMQLDSKLFDLNSSAAIVINFEAKEILISGTSYSGEIKKAIFAVMNTLLPDLGVLPMHAGANIDEGGDVSVFFGLSGTGKTTLSTDIGKKMVGDDELGFSVEGIFNMEGGCYAKAYKLNAKQEPLIYQAANRFGTILENVVMDDQSVVDFNDKSIAENSRASYPLSFLSEVQTSGKAKAPKDIFFLSADATGVLPAVSLLNRDQAIFYFLSGYTAKLGGTELGLSGVQKTFSHCFGAPFMMRNPKDYAKLLEQLLDKTGANVWLINTGWGSGPYGVGARYDLLTTRNIIRSIQSGALSSNSKFNHDEVFNLAVPVDILSVDGKLLNPKGLWSDPSEYDQAAKNLKIAFEQNYEKFKN